VTDAAVLCVVAGVVDGVAMKTVVGGAVKTIVVDGVAMMDVSTPDDAFDAVVA
jgi:hypothetical protein